MFLANRVLATKFLTAKTPLLRSGLKRGLPSTQAAFFSKEEAKAEKTEPTAAEVEANKEEWGIKYDDECLKFEKEWQEIADKVQNEQMVYLESELSDL